MKKLPKGYIIDNPYDLIRTEFYLTDSISNLLKTNNTVYFTRLSVKHLAEKHDGKYLLKIIKEILRNPDSVYIGNFSNRFLITKSIIFNGKNRPHLVNIEITKEGNNIIVTSFICKDAYFKNLRLLWGTASPHLNNS